VPDVWVYSERKDVALELLGKGREIADGLGASLGVLLLGKAFDSQESTFISYGADKVFLLESPWLQEALPEPYSEAISKLALGYRPDVLLVGSTKRGKDVAARIAARLDTGLMTDCFALNLDKEKRAVVADRFSYGGILVSSEVCTTKPQIVSVPPRVFEPPSQNADRRGEVIRTEIELEPPKSRVLQASSKQAKGVKLEEAEIIVAGGKGLVKKEDFAVLESLAEVLGGEVGCSSPIAEDLKWLPLERLIGLTGHKVKPKLYVACGISGQPQHITGMRDSHVVVAINNDPEAPIFEQSDYCIRGDLYEIVPLLTEVFRKRYQK
jgi:electron transfer flavoprotein alpha subunit